MSDRPRFRVRADGWVRHEGGNRPSVLRPTDRISIAVRSGNVDCLQGLEAAAYFWPHRHFSGDIILWRPLP